MMSTFDLALAVSAVWVGLVSLVTGMLLVHRRTARGPPHPFISAFVSGLLVGMSCLVVLPEALSQLPDAGWTQSQVLVLFLGAAALMFFLDHSVMTHAHVAQGESLEAPIRPQSMPSKRDRPPGAVDCEESEHRAPRQQVEASTPEDAPADPTDDEVAPDRPPREQHISRDRPPQISCDELPVPKLVSVPPVAWCPCHGGDPFAKGFGFNFNPLKTTRECPIIKAHPQSFPSPPASPPWPTAAGCSEGDVEEGYAYTKKRRLQQHEEGEPARCNGAHCQRRGALAVRVCAWMLHAMIDGMVLSSAPSTAVLVATTMPISACALQDVAAFTFAMARLGTRSSRSLTLAVVAISCAFPIGALASHAVLERASSIVAVNVVRTVVAGIFVYMALFELTPPHTHSRAANTCYLICFTCGAAMAYAVDVVAQHTTGAEFIGAGAAGGGRA